MRDFVAEFTETQRRDEYLASMLGVYGLSYIVAYFAFDLCDDIEGKLPGLYRQNVKRCCKAIVGDGKRKGSLDKVQEAAEIIKGAEHGRAYLTDFGRTICDKVAPDLQRLTYTVANEVGRFNVPDINVFARLIVTQSFASDAADFARRKISRFDGVRVRYGDRQYAVCDILRRLSTIETSHYLTSMAVDILRRYLPGDYDIFKNKDVVIGLKAVLNKLNDNKNWMMALDYADAQNPHVITRIKNEKG